MFLRYTGRHYVHNALSAAAVARHVGLSVHDIAQGLSTARVASPWRMAVTERPDGVAVINDAYNANPTSMRSALATQLASHAHPSTSGR
ncbi:hypothetical protein [Streptomyces sp. NPDC002851]